MTGSRYKERALTRSTCEWCGLTSPTWLKHEWPTRYRKTGRVTCRVRDTRYRRTSTKPVTRGRASFIALEWYPSDSTTPTGGDGRRAARG